MEKRITENELLLPALYVIAQTGKANTSQVIRELSAAFGPEGEDAEILAGRRDTKFSQKVRNLMGSHYSANGMSAYTVKDKRGCFHLTERGERAVEENRSYLAFLFEQHFSYAETRKLAAEVYSAQGKKHRLYIYDENDVILEGGAAVRNEKVRARSGKLRQAAVDRYTVDGRLRCAVCGFDFYERYGERGRGYIQIHHENPIYQYSDEGVAACISEAVEHMKPVCANCHCMLHRGGGRPLSLDELRAMLETQNTGE